MRWEARKQLSGAQVRSWGDRQGRDDPGIHKRGRLVYSTCTENITQGITISRPGTFTIAEVETTIW